MTEQIVTDEKRIKEMERQQLKNDEKWKNWILILKKSGEQKESIATN